jgi:DNA-binding response OmpR family regulator
MAKILIVEDDETLARMYKKKLVFEGFIAILAFSGEEGLALVQKEKPDLILLDIMMPGIDGFEVVRRIRKIEEIKNIPIIMLTNLGTSDVFVDEAKKLGVKNYLVKYKTSSATLVATIKEELGM